jgi:hypothetical protein
MAAHERSSAEYECERLVYRYTHLVDFGRGSELPGLFTEDGVFDNGDLRLEGSGQLMRAFAAREAATDLRTRHVCTNVLIDVLSETTASGVVYLTLYRAWAPAGRPTVELRGPGLVGSYHDTYRLVDGIGWRIASRIVQAPFVNPDDVAWTTTSDAG